VTDESALLVTVPAAEPPQASPKSMSPVTVTASSSPIVTKIWPGTAASLPD
jgi:hypothetical protein